MFEQAFKNIDDVLWKEAGCTTELDYTEQSSWLLFLKYLDGLEADKATEAELAGKKYTYILDKPYRWETWAAPKGKDGKLDHNKAPSGDDLRDFVNLKLFPYLHGFKQKATGPNTIEYKIGEIFGEIKNKISSGYNLREIIDHVDELRFRSQAEKHELSHLYEAKIKNMGNAGRNGGEYYTPRPLIRAIVRVVNPKIGERIYDGAVGSAGFLCEAFDYLKETNPKRTTAQDKTLQERTFYGKEKKSLAYVIAIMNMILHGIEAPNIIHTNTLTENLADIQDKDRYDVVLAKPLTADYVLVYRNHKLAVVEAKAENEEVTEGVGQAKNYAGKLAVRYTYATNGKGIYGIDMQTGKERDDITQYPTPDELWNMTFATANSWRDNFASVPYEDKGGSHPGRYYQDIAIERVLDAIANNKSRILLTLATGTGKTFIAFQLAWKLFHARWNLSREPSRRPRILFLADRNILANQAYNAFSAFPEDALVRIAPDEIKKKGKVPKNGSIFFTIFQTFMSGPVKDGKGTQIIFAPRLEHDLAAGVRHDGVIYLCAICAGVKNLARKLICENQMKPKTTRLIKILGNRRGDEILEFINVNIERFDCLGVRAFSGVISSGTPLPSTIPSFTLLPGQRGIGSL